MMKKIFSFISAANQIVFFVAAIVIGVMFTLSVVNDRDTPNKVEIVQGSEQESSSKKTVYTKEFGHRIKDVLIFTIKAEVIDLNAKNIGSHVLKKSATFGSGYYFNSDQTVNVMFVTTGEAGRLLFENDRLVTDIKVVNDKQEHRGDYLLSKNLYTTIDADSNGDGFLGEDDEKTLYVSDYNGENLKQILAGISKVALINDNTVLIIQGEKQKKQFHLYNVESGEIQLIDTGI